jgi:hypothetical protein
MKRLDFLLITVYITVSVLIGYVLLWGPSDAPEGVEIKVDNQLVAEYTLPTKEPIEFETDELGHNIVVIDGYDVYMKESDCPDQICVQQGTITKAGTLLVCLPNKLTVEITGKRADDVDIISH